MNEQYLATLTGTQKILYKTSYNFEIEHCKGTPESAHEAGVKKVESSKKLVKTLKFKH